MNFSSQYPYIPESGGNRELPPAEQISLTIRRVTVRDMFGIQRIIKDRLDSAGVNLMAVDPNDPAQVERFWDLVDPVVRRHTENWKNMVLDGVPVTDPGTLIDLCSFSQMQLMAEVAGEVLRIGKVGDQDSKNSVSESAPANSDSDTTVPPVSAPISSESETAEVPL